MLLQLVIIALVVWIFKFQWNQRPLRELAKKMPSNIKSYPFIGHGYLLFAKNVNRQIMKLIILFARECHKNDGVAAFWIGPSIHIMVGDPIVAEFICKHALAKGDLYEFFKIAIGNGSVFAPVPIWRPRRKILAPTFSPKHLNSFVQIFDKQSGIMVDLLKAKAGQGSFSIWEYMTSYSMDSVCETTLGIKLNIQKQRNHRFLEAFEIGCSLTARRLFQFWKHSQTIYRLFPEYQTIKKMSKVMIDFTNDVIKSKRKEIEKRKTGNKPVSDETVKSFLELLLESRTDEKPLIDEELREECLVLILAGTDTSAVGACFTLLILSMYPNVQEKVFEELRGIFKDDWIRPIVAEDLSKMKYLDAVIKESLRMYPPVPLIMRKITNPLTLPSGQTLMSGVNVMINLWGINRHPKYWGPDADEFRPERFIEPLMCPSAFASFSYNPRNCLGYQYAMLSAKTVIASVIRSYKVLPAMDSNQTPCNASEPIETTFQIMMKDVNNFKLQLECRK